MGNPGASIGPYALFDRYAVGGTAEIYRARDTRTSDGEIVVIKRLRPDKLGDAVARAGFEREVMLAQLMKHGNLIHGREKGTVNGLDYVVLDFVDGPDLARVLVRARERGITIPLVFNLFIVREVLAGLDFAHRLASPDGWPLGLVHRDLSPRNVFVGYDGAIRVADFGSSLFTLLEPAPAAVVGSPGYLAPEQALLGPLDARADVFVAGCILYELVTGEGAFDVAGKKDGQVLKIHQKGRIRPLPRGVPDNVQRIITRACAAERDQRYPTAAAMRDDVDAILAGQAYTTSLAIAHLTRQMFREEFKASRLPGSPLTF